MVSKFIDVNCLPFQLSSEHLFFASYINAIPKPSVSAEDHKKIMFSVFDKISHTLHNNELENI